MIAFVFEAPPLQAKQTAILEEWPVGAFQGVQAIYMNRKNERADCDEQFPLSAAI